MEHVSKIIEKKKLSDGQIAVLIRCCEDVTTDSWHTLTLTTDTAPDDVTAWLVERKANVQTQHAASLAAAAVLDTL